MDNAAKGLIVAGGILLAIMTLTLLVYGLSATSRINIAQDEADALQELTNFNIQQKKNVWCRCNNSNKQGSSKQYKYECCNKPSR